MSSTSNTNEEPELATFQKKLYDALVKIGVKRVSASRFARGKTETELKNTFPVSGWVRKFCEERFAVNAQIYGVTNPSKVSLKTALLLVEVEPALANVALDPDEQLPIFERVETWIWSRFDLTEADSEWLRALSAETTPGSFRPMRAKDKTTRLGFRCWDPNSNHNP